MARPSLRALARKVVGRIGSGGSGTPTGDSFGPHNDMAFAVLSEESDSAFARLGASLVGAWEVGITDLARVLEPRMETKAKNRLTERVSDGLVPTQQPLNDAKKQFVSAVRTGAQAGLASGRLADATVAPTAVLAELGPSIGAGWPKTADYLDPLFEQLPGDEVKQRYLDLGPKLQALFQEEGERFADAMAALPKGTDLARDVSDAIETWYANSSRGVELIIYDARTVLVEAAKELPLKDA